MFFRWLLERKIIKLERKEAQLVGKLEELRRVGYGNDNIAGELAAVRYDLKRLMEKL